MSATEIVESAFTALEESGAAHVSGTISGGSGEQELDLHLQDGDTIGSVTFGGFTVELVLIDGTSYLNGPAAFWTETGAPADVAAQLDGVWILMPAEAGSPFESLTLEGLVAELVDTEPGALDGAEVTTDERDGEPVVVVSRTDGSTLVVADSDPSYPLEIESEGTESGSVTFSRFGEREDITAPEGAVDISQLGG